MARKPYASTPSDEPNAGNPEREPCSGRVRVWRDENGKVERMRLVCVGTCPGTEKCRRRRSEDHHGGVREWCGCSDKEPTECHIVIATRGEGQGGGAGEQEILCAGSCSGDPEARCTPIIVREWKRYPSGTVVEVACRCL